MRSIAAVGVLVLAGSAMGQSISLASTMDTNGFVSEDSFTFAFAQIGQGDGTLGTAMTFGDADGLYSLAKLGAADPGPTFGTPVDLFPREENFEVGSIGYDTAAISGNGIETTSITSLDLSGLWTADPNRVNGVPGSTPTVLSDISDRAIGLWFFDAPGSIDFGAFDASDTVTFTDGLLTSIDVSVAADFVVDGFGVYSGTLEFSGNGISFQIDDVSDSLGNTVVIDLTGTVNAVVPAPGTALLLAAGAFGATRRRR
ncbi:MAG: PEP-CTERM sorting domain-containing protein [Planctomycetota bacterium]